MNILIINFSIDGISHEDYLKITEELAPVFATVPGLKSKDWLSDQENNVYGGVYTFENKQSLDDYCASELFAGVGSNPNFTNISVKSFEVLEGPTKICRNCCDCC
ncbi:MAG: YdhR family protein [Fidelibacterota bacterium]